MATIPASNEPAQAAEALAQSFSFPASFAQRRLWFIDQFVPGDISYNIAGALEIEGSVNAHALEQTLQEIIRRHESLRTRFAHENGEVMQVIDSELPFSLELLDLTSLPQEERLSNAENEARLRARKPFDLQRGPLFHATLIKITDERYKLVVVMHHIISDGWSIGVLVRELAVLYSAFCEDKPSPLPDLPIQYVDFTAWQQEQHAGNQLQPDIDYWSRQLEGSNNGLQLTTDYPRTVNQVAAAGQYEMWLEPGLVRALRRMAQDQGVTLYMVLLGGFQTLLFKYSGQEEILVGSPIAGRTRAETEELIGFFINTLVMKSRFTEGITFRELLKQVKETTLEAYAHQELPFERLVEVLAPDRSLGRTPFFQATLNLQNAPMPELQLGSAKLRMHEIDSATAKFEMMLAFTEEPDDSIRTAIEYNADWYEAKSIVRLMDQFVFLLKGLIHDLDRPLSQVPIVAEDERLRLAKGWRAAMSREISDSKHTIIDLVAEHARQKEKAAMIAGEQEVSYRELAELTAGLSARLLAKGITAGTRVLISVSEGWFHIPAILGVLRAGAVAVPLDYDEPPARLAYILKDSKINVAITEARFSEQYVQAGLQCINMDGENEDSQSVEKALDGLGIREDSAALMIYQSGASGKPQGILIPHAGLMPRKFDGGAGILTADRVAQRPRKAAEENAILEMLRFICSGATVVQLDAALAPRKLATLLREQEITVLCARSSEIERLAREFSATLKNVRLIVCEERGAPLARLAENLKPEIAGRVHAAYGVNETCGWLALYPLAEARKGIACHLAAGTKLELLDKEMEPVPEGIMGTIYIGGSQLALHRDEGAHPDFLHDEYEENQSAQIFRSGDLAWRRSDGTLEIYGRHDGRGWIAGIRVQAEEIESALAGYEDVLEVAARVGREGVAVFLVLNSESDPDKSKIDAYLQDKLPSMMVPSVIYKVKSIPRSANGTIDRVRLETMAEQLEKSRNAAVKYVAPETDIQRQVASIWAQTLGLEKIGIHDDFFQSGGHSLLATQVLSQINHDLGVEVPLRKLFEAPTVAQLAQVVTQLSSATEKQTEVIPQVRRAAQAQAS